MDQLSFLDMADIGLSAELFLMARPRATGPSRDGPPVSFPEGTPGMTGYDHSFTLQAVMEMNKTLGGLGEKIDRLRADVDTLGKRLDDNSDKVDKINTKLAWATGIAAGIAAVVMVIWGIVGIIPWDRITVSSSEPAATAAKGSAEAATPPKEAQNSSR